MGRLGVARFEYMAEAGAEGALAAVRRRDELLSLMYWLRADRLHDEVGTGDLAPFAGPVAPLEEDLRELVRAGLAEPHERPDGGRYRLTRVGLEEGKRRFEEELTTAPGGGVAGNAHEVIIGVCGPNAKCVRDGTHDDCAEPELMTVIEPGETGGSARSTGTSEGG